MPKSKPITHFHLSEQSLKKLNKVAPPEMSFRARIELAIDMAWKMHKFAEK
jgi:hypothetical protein